MRKDQTGEARAIYKKAVANFNTGRNAHDHRKGFLLLKEAASLNYVPAHEWLGAAYYYGLGVRPNRQQAFKHDLIAAKAGDATSKYHVGISYLAGRGVRKNSKLGIRWLER